MQNRKLILIVVSLVVSLFVCGFAVAAKQSLVNNSEISACVSPSTIKLSSLGGTVSVHTNIKYVDADAGSLSLSGLSPYLVKSDDCGYLVAKFDVDAVKEIVAVPSTVLIFSGSLVDGTVFAVEDEVKVTK